MSVGILRRTVVGAGMKPCTKCGASDRYADGHCKPCNRASGRKHYRANSERLRAASKAWYQNNKERAKPARDAWARNNPEKKQEINRRWVEKDPERAKQLHKASTNRLWPMKLMCGARAASKQRGHSPPTITKAWIEEQFIKSPVCPYTGVPLVPPNLDAWAGRRCPWAPSLDRIDCSEGYTPENTHR